MSTGASTTGTQQAFHSQTDTDRSPQLILHILSPAMSQAGSSSSSSGAGTNVPKRPIFAPQDNDIPTINKLVSYIGAVEWHIGNMEFLLDFLGDD